MAEYATLAVGRVRVPVVDAKSDGKVRHLRKHEAYDHYTATVVRPHEKENEKLHAQHLKEVAAFDRNVKITKDLEVKRDVGGLRKARFRIDEVRLGDEVFEVDAGRAKAFVDRKRAERCKARILQKPQSFDDWFKSLAKEHRTWKADFIRSTLTEAMDLPIDVEYAWGFPSAAVNALLEKLADEGWRLIHVSEDRGLYRGEDAQNESAPTRARFLMERNHQ
jgi:hypothetical protein